MEHFLSISSEKNKLLQVVATCQPIQSIKEFFFIGFKQVQVNLCQKLLILHQLIHNMTTDCSWNLNYHENYKRRTWAKHILPMFCACSFDGNFRNNLLSYCGLIDAEIRASGKDLPVPNDILNTLISVRNASSFASVIGVSSNSNKEMIQVSQPLYDAKT